MTDRIAFQVMLVAAACSMTRGAEPAAHWPLTAPSPGIIRHGVKFSEEGAYFDGRGAYLEVAQPPRLGAADFSIAAWVRADGGEVSGDLFSRYDAVRRLGFHLSIQSNAVTTSQANRRQLQFGLANDRRSTWTDRGRPGNAVLAFSLAVHDGYLYAGVCEPGENERGRVFQSRGDGRWEPCGSPDASNAVTALAVYQGRLFAATGKYRLAGSALAESKNPNLGGGVYRYEGNGEWSDCGRLPQVEAVGGLVVFRGKLYASSLYKPAGFFRYEGHAKWTALPTPNGKRVEAMAVYRDQLFATGYDEGHVYRFDGTAWTDLGRLGDNTQTYSLAVYQGQLHVGAWPSGRVYRMDLPRGWTDVGRLGNELEVMGMVVHNGRLLAGTLPLAEVYGYDGGTTWTRLTQLDHTPGVRYRRAWTAAEFRGEVYFSTLPSGKIWSFAEGVSATWDREFPEGWRHVAAVRDGERLRLYVDGAAVAESRSFEPAAYDVDADRPLLIGAGATETFHGMIRDARIYHRALSAADIRKLVEKR